MQHEGITVAVDALGGDAGASVVLPGVEAALQRRSDLCVELCGPADVVDDFAARHERVTAVHATQEITMAEHPAQAVRKKRDSSIVVACKRVHDGHAQGMFSAGSTGAIVVAAVLTMHHIKGVKRPAICTVIPSPVRNSVLCDLGANADCKPEYIVQFAKMARIYAEKALGRKDPTIAQLNIGTEDTKGSKFAQECFDLLSREVPGFKGNCEGYDVVQGTYDVVVTDGFTGNVCLKTIEGTAKTLGKTLKNVLLSNAKTKIAALLLKNDISVLRTSLNADQFGGAPLLGVKGACLIGHGGSDATAIANGVLATANIIEWDVPGLIEKEMRSDASRADTDHATSGSADDAALDR